MKRSYNRKYPALKSDFIDFISFIYIYTWKAGVPNDFDLKILNYDTYTMYNISLYNNKIFFTIKTEKKKKKERKNKIDLIYIYIYIIYKQRLTIFEKKKRKKS